MKCPNCNKVIKKTDKTCHFCGKDVKKEEIVTTRIIYQMIESPSNKWLILTVGILSFIILIETSLGIWYIFFRENNINISPNIKIIKTPIKRYFANETFTFDNLEITFSNKYEITKLENKYSTYDGKEVIVIPVNIKNISENMHSLNLYYYTIYGPNVNELDEVAGYFDEALYYEEDLEQLNSHTKYLYFLYDEDGIYTIKFNNGIEQIVVKYEINKNKLDNID